MSTVEKFDKADLMDQTAITDTSIPDRRPKWLKFVKH